MFLIMTSKILDLLSAESVFLIYVWNIFIFQSIFSAVFEDPLLYEISEDFCHLKYNFYMYYFSLELAV